MIDCFPLSLRANLCAGIYEATPLVEEKLMDARGLPRVEKIEGKLSSRWGKGTVVIPAPVEVDELMRRVPRGRVVTIQELRSALAKRHGATIACPITTGIFAWVAAHAADEAERAGQRNVTPYWRTLKTGGELNGKYPGGIALLCSRLEAEGHRIVAKGSRRFVADHVSALPREFRNQHS